MVREIEMETESDRDRESMQVAWISPKRFLECLLILTRTWCAELPKTKKEHVEMKSLEKDL